MDAKVKPQAISPERNKFVALAQKRMNKAIKAIRAVGQLDRKRSAYDEADAHDMAATLEVEIATIRGRLLAGMEPDFRLDAQGEE